MTGIDLAAGAIVDTWKGRGRILSWRRTGGVTYLTLSVGEDVRELTLREFLTLESRPHETVVSLPTSEFLDGLDKVERRRVLMRRGHIHDVICPQPFDPNYPVHDPTKPDEHPQNRYTAEMSRSERVKRKLVDCAAYKKDVKAAKAKGVLKDRKDGPYWGRTQLYDLIRRYQRDGDLAFVHDNRLTDADVARGMPKPVVDEVFAYYVTTVRAPKKNANVHYANAMKALEDAGLVPEQVDRAARKAAEDVLPRHRFDALWRVAESGAPKGRSAKTIQSQDKRPGELVVKHDAHDFGDIIEMDATPCDFLVRGVGGPFKPHAVFAVDVATRYTWMRLTVGPPQASDYQMLLFDIINPYEWEPIHPDFRGLLHPELVLPDAVYLPTRPHTCPKNTCMDHGSEGENAGVASLLVRLMVTVLWARTRTPDDKARVEAYIRTFAFMAQLMPGYKGNSVANSGEQEPDPDTLLSFEAAWTICRGFSYWYNQQPHSGLTTGPFGTGVMSPIEAVESSLSRGVPLRVANNPNLIFDFLPTYRVVPQDNGVTITTPGGRITYCTGPDHDYTEQVYRHCYKAGQGRRKRTFHYDPHDPSRIFFNEPGTYNWIPLYAPGALASAVRPLEDIRRELHASLGSQRRSTRRERDAALAELEAKIIRPIAEIDSTRQVDRPVLPAAKPRATDPAVSNAALAELETLSWMESA